MKAFLKEASGNVYIWAAAVLVLRGVLMGFLPLTDTTEARYGLIAKEIVQSGDWVIPHVWFDGQYVPFLGKPPLFFWGAAGCMKLFGINEFSARLPSLLAFALTLVIMAVILRRYLSSRAAATAVYLGITCVVLLAACGLVIVDMLLTFAVTGAVLGFYAFCQEQDKQRRKAWSVWTAGMLGIGFMTKGPVVLVMVGLPVLIWSLLFRRWKDLRTQQWYLGITLFGLMVAPWFIAAELRSPGFLRYFFINENLLRFVVHEYGDRYGDGHIYPRGTAVLMMLLAAAPWSIVGPIQFFKNRKILSFALLRKDPLLMYFLLVVVVNTLFLAMARQLLMTYLFPLVPAYLVFLAMLRERVLQLSFFDERKISSAGVALVAGVAVVGMLAVPYSMGCSTKSILTKAQAYKKAGEKIYFVRRVPFSAYYYAPADVLPHPDESVDVSLKTVLERKDPVLVVSHKEYFRPFKALPRADRISQLTQSGNYVLAQIETTPEITDRQQHAGL